MKRTRINIYLDRDHASRLDELATMKRISKSSLIAAALAAFLAPESPERREAALSHRLDSLGKRLERLDRDQTILIEAFALYLRHHFAVTAPIPDAHQSAARAQGRARFEQFIEQLARHLQRGHSLVKDVRA